MTTTPGPWHFNGRRITTGAFIVADIWNADEPTGQANAALIAAAPDLLTIAKDIYPMFLDCSLYADHDRGTELLGQLRQAIEQAEGRHP